MKELWIKIIVTIMLQIIIILISEFWK